MSDQIPTEAEVRNLVVQNADVLRYLAKREAELGEVVGMALTAFGSAIGRDPSNLSKTLKRLEAAGVVSAREPALTEAGRAWLPRLDALDGKAVGVAGLPRAPHDRFRPNPNQPRKHFDEDELRDLAETFRERGIMQQLRVSAPDDAGVMVIAVGERRWRATGLLIEAGEDPADFQLPYEIDEAFDPDDAAQAAEIALVENGARSDLTKMEQARGCVAILDANPGMTIVELARRIGKAREGSLTGVRAVQEMVKVAREADPADIEKFEDGATDEGGLWSWKRLLETTQVKKPAAEPAPADEPDATADSDEVELSPADLLILAEVLDAQTVRPHFVHGLRAALVGNSASEQGERDRLQPLRYEGYLASGFGSRGPFLRVTERGIEVLQSKGLATGDQALLRRARDWAGLHWATISALEADSRYHASWLNLDVDPCFYNGTVFPNATLASEAKRRAEGGGGYNSGGGSPKPAPPPPAPESNSPPPSPSEPQSLPELTPAEELAMLELVHAVQVAMAQPGGRDRAPIEQDWIHDTAINLQSMKLVRLFPADNGRFAELTELGREWVYARPNKYLVNVVDLDKARYAATGKVPGAVIPYVTPWLNVTADPAPAVEEPDDEVAQANRALQLASALPANDDPEWRAAFARAVDAADLGSLVAGESHELGCLFVAGDVEPAAFVDVDNQLIPAMADARTRLIAAAFNRALTAPAP